MLIQMLTTGNYEKFLISLQYEGLSHLRCKVILIRNAGFDTKLKSVLGVSQYEPVFTAVNFLYN